MTITVDFTFTIIIIIIIIIIVATTNYTLLGVIWRLAAAGRLRDVEHLSLVSGGSYVGTALVTFILAALREPEEAGADLSEEDEEPRGDRGQAGQSSSSTNGARAETPSGSAGPHIGDLDAWYLRVTWRLIERMQSNAGFLVRFSTHPFQRKDIYVHICIYTYICISRYDL